MFVPTTLAFCMPSDFEFGMQLCTIFSTQGFLKGGANRSKIVNEGKKKTAVKILREYIKRGKENKLLSKVIKMKSYYRSSHFTSLFFAPIVTGVLISKRVYYPHNVMVYSRKKKEKTIKNNYASLLSISFVSPCYI